MPPKSRFWEFFERLENNEARCRFCFKIIKTCGNTTNLKLHVDKMHSTLLGKHRSEENTVQKTGAKKTCIESTETVVNPSIPTASTSTSPDSVLCENSVVDYDCANDISASSSHKKNSSPHSRTLSGA